MENNDAANLIVKHLLKLTGKVENIKCDWKRRLHSPVFYNFLVIYFFGQGRWGFGDNEIRIPSANRRHEWYSASLSPAEKGRLLYLRHTLDLVSEFFRTVYAAFPRAKLDAKMHIINIYNMGPGKETLMILASGPAETAWRNPNGFFILHTGSLESEF